MSEDDKTRENDAPPEAEEQASKEEQGPDAADLDKDPAYEPEDEYLKGIKGG
jgi:hypothetical protein